MGNEDSSANSGSPVMDEQAKRYSNIYYFIRNLYFTPAVNKIGLIIHKHSSEEIARNARSHYHVPVSASSIRNWMSSPDKDFEGRTWRQEWNRGIAEGIINASGQPPYTGHPFESGKTVTEIPLTPMQHLAKLKQQTIKNDMDICIAGDTFIKLYIREMKDDYERTGIVPFEKLRTLGAFHRDAKARVMHELKDLKDIESQMDRELQYGKLVALKDPQARNRVRNVFLKMIELAYEKGKVQEEKSREDIIEEKAS